MDKFRDLLPKFIQFCDKVVPLVNSGELVLPFGALTRKDAKTFKNKLKHFPEFVELLDAITRNKNFSNYFDKVKSQYDSPDWEESDATHLTDINWHAVEVIRTLLENVLKTGDPRKEFQVLSDYIDKRAIDAPVHIHVKSNLKIEMDNSMEDLDDMIKLQFKGEENKVFNYVFKTHVTVRFTDDYRDVDIERMRYEVYKILGRFITSLILMNVSIDYFRLEVVGVETYGCISLPPWGVWPNALDGLTLSSSEGLVYISEIFTRNLPPPDVNPEPESLRERTMGLPPPFKVRVLQVQFGTLKQVWRQLNELESRIKGLDKKIIVIGKRFYQMSVIRKGEDFFLHFCVLLESLILKTDERDGLSHKFSLRASLLTSSNNTDVKKLFHHFEKAYRIRSKILHGKSIGELEWGEYGIIFPVIPGIFYPGQNVLVVSLKILKKFLQFYSLSPTLEIMMN